MICNVGVGVDTHTRTRKMERAIDRESRSVRSVVRGPVILSWRRIVVGDAKLNAKDNEVFVRASMVER